MKQLFIILFILVFSFEYSISKDNFKVPEKVIQMGNVLDSLTGFQKARLLIDLAVEYYNIKLRNKSTDYKSKALELIHGVPFDKTDVWQLTLFGDIYRINDSLEKALPFYQDALLLTENSKNKNQVASLHFKTGKTFERMGGDFWSNIKYGAPLKDIPEATDSWPVFLNLYQEAIFHFKFAIETWENINIADEEKMRGYQGKIAETYHML